MHDGRLPDPLRLKPPAAMRCPALPSTLDRPPPLRPVAQEGPYPSSRIDTSAPPAMAQLYAHTAHYVGHLLHNHPSRRPSVGASAAAADPSSSSPSLVSGTNGAHPVSLKPSRLSREQLVEQLVDLIVMEEEDAAKDLMGVELGLAVRPPPLSCSFSSPALSLLHPLRRRLPSRSDTPASG